MGLRAIGRAYQLRGFYNGKVTICNGKVTVGLRAERTHPLDGRALLLSVYRRILLPAVEEFLTRYNTVIEGPCCLQWKSACPGAFCWLEGFFGRAPLLLGKALLI